MKEIGKQFQATMNIGKYRANFRSVSSFVVNPVKVYTHFRIHFNI